MKQYLITMTLLVLSIYCLGKDDKGDKNKQKVIDKEERKFEKDIKRDPNSAMPYLDHANALAAINSEIARAEQYYQLALKHDSGNAVVYKKYGMYLCDKQAKYKEAKHLLDKASSLSPGDEELKKYLGTVNKFVDAQNTDDRMRDFGHITIKELNPNIDYKSITKFDSLRLLIDAPGIYNYQALLTRFLSDDTTLRPDEMYMLIVGYSKQKAYNPFKYTDISEMRVIAFSNADSGIKKGEELLIANPLNPSLNREMMYCYRKKNQPAQADKYLYRIKQFFNGVLYSGDGTCEKPYISLWAKEEYNFITYLGYKSTDNHAMGMCAGQMAEKIDMINPATDKIEPIHFNVALIYMQAVGK